MAVVRKRDIALTFEGECTVCSGTGNWMRREGYPCRTCGATGRVKVAAVRGRYGFTFRVVTAKGTVTKEKYMAAARLTRELPRFDCGSTIGSGWWEEQRGTDPVGAECAVYGLMFGGSDAGEVLVRLPGGGYGTTGTRVSSLGNETTVEVEVTETAAATAIAELREKATGRERQLTITGELRR